jgi:hypothetical protein
MGPVRTHEGYFIDLKKCYQHDPINKVISGEPVNGVKGSCCLSYLKYFRPVQSTCIDYMHSLLEGVIKTFFKYWFSSECSSYPCSVRKYLKEIDSRLCKIRPPKFVPSTPRSIYSHNIWRAHEYLSFMLYYALPVLRDILQLDYYNNLKKLVLSMEILLSPAIDMITLKNVEATIVSFVEEVSLMYPPGIMLSGMHETLHLVSCTLDFGPLNTTNCFQVFHFWLHCILIVDFKQFYFKVREMNRKLMGFIHGKDLIGEELIKIFSTAQILSRFANSENMKNHKLREFINERLKFKSANIKRQADRNSGIKITDKIEQMNDTQHLEVFRKFLCLRNIAPINVCHRIIFNGIAYTSIRTKTKRNDSCFINEKTNKIGAIECFVVFESTVYIIAKKIVVLFKAVELNCYPKIESKLCVCYVSDQIFVEKIENIKKIVLIDISNSNCFVSLFRSSHLFN